jgi:hypothetical protein
MRLPSFPAVVATAVLGLLGPVGCASDPDDTGANESDVTAATCGLDPASPASARSVMDAPFRDPPDAERRLGCLRTILTTQRDNRAPFASLYADITISAHAAIRAGRFQDGPWVSRYLTTFAELYRVAFVGYADGRPGEIPGSWRIAFDAAREDRALVVQHVSLGVNAHVDRDLAHTLVTVGLGRDDAERERRKSDHFKVNDILKENVDATLGALADRYAQGLAEAPPVVMRILSTAYFHTVTTGRLKAWLDALALEKSGPLRPVVEGQIELSSRLIGEAILAPASIDPRLFDRLRAIEASGF